MNLFELLVYTQHQSNASAQYTILEDKSKVSQELSNEGGVNALAVIVPSVVDAAAVISMAKTFVNAKDLYSAERVIENTISNYRRCVVNGGKLDDIKFIQDLIITIVNHNDFCINFKDKENIHGERIYRFMGLVPVLQFDIITAIINGKNYVPLAESIGKMYNNCIGATKNFKENVDKICYTVKAEVVGEQDIVITLNTYNDYLMRPKEILFFDKVRELTITMELFDKFIKNINTYIISASDIHLSDFD